MKSNILIGFVVLISSTISAFSQEKPMPPTERPRVIITTPTPTLTPLPTPKIVVVTPPPTPTPMTNNASLIAPPVTTSPTFYKPLSLKQIKSKIEEAKRQMQARPIPTALTDSFLITDVIRIAFYDYKTAQVDYIVMMKTAFLAKNTETATTTTRYGRNMGGVLTASRLASACFVDNDDDGRLRGR